MADLLTAVSYSTSTTPYSEGKNLYTALFDDDLTTFADYNGTDASITMTYSRYANISRIEYSARNDDWASRIVGGTIEGSNDGSYWITLHTISAYTLGEITSVEIDSKGAYKYIRFSCPYLNCSLLRLYGEERDAPAFDGWYGDENGNISNSKFPSMPESAMSEPYPSALWRVSSTINNGEPYHELMPGIAAINLWTHPQKPLIQVYDSRSSVPEFERNGLAVIQPISYTVRHELGGVYDAELEAELDDSGKSSYLENNAILKIPIEYHDSISEQLFRIFSVSKQMDSSGSYRILVSARHIFYDLNSKVLIDCQVPLSNGRDAIGYLMDSVYGGWSSSDTRFTGVSDITTMKAEAYTDITLTAALIGADNSLISRWGGYLYRDNFYFSINQTMENSRCSGVIRYAYNMIDIDFTIDFSDCFTYLIAFDNFGNMHKVVNPDVPCKLFPHHIYKVMHFSYDAENPDQFIADAEAYAENYKNGTVNIKVNFAKLSDLELYADFLELRCFEPGDRVTVYHEDLDIHFGNLEVISKEYSGSSESTYTVEIGNFKGAVSRSGYMSGTVSSGQSAADKQLAAVKSQLDEVAFDTYITTPVTTIDGKYLTTIDGKYLLYKE